MNLSVEWDDSTKTILCYTIAGNWSWQDLDALLAKGDEMVVGITERIDIIIDAGEMKVFPRDIFEVVPQRYNLHSRNGGISVLVGANTTIRSILDMLILTKPRMFSHYRFADTIDDAHRVIAKNRAKISR